MFLIKRVRVPLLSPSLIFGSVARESTESSSTNLVSERKVLERMESSEVTAFVFLGFLVAMGLWIIILVLYFLWRERKRERAFREQRLKREKFEAHRSRLVERTTRRKSESSSVTSPIEHQQALDDWRAKVRGAEAPERRRDKYPDDFMDQPKSKLKIPARIGENQNLEDRYAHGHAKHYDFDLPPIITPDLVRMKSKPVAGTSRGRGAGLSRLLPPMYAPPPIPEGMDLVVPIGTTGKPRVKSRESKAREEAKKKSRVGRLAEGVQHPRSGFLGAGAGAGSQIPPTLVGYQSRGVRPHNAGPDDGWPVPPQPLDSSPELVEEAGPTVVLDPTSMTARFHDQSRGSEGSARSAREDPVFHFPPPPTEDPPASPTRSSSPPSSPTSIGSSQGNVSLHAPHEAHFHR